MMDKTILNDRRALSTLYESHTTTEIGEMVGCHNEIVRKALHRHGIRVRGKGARTVYDQIDRAVVRFKNQLREFGPDQRREIVRRLQDC